ncbi:MAG: hypothetical protein J3T61_07645 [Candidatus Brocadiales bacterium]|nr:hypothetical protein [Candidatus Bathyanammoxibius sp.]
MELSQLVWCEVTRKVDRATTRIPNVRLWLKADIRWILKFNRWETKSSGFGANYSADYSTQAVLVNKTTVPNKMETPNLFPQSLRINFHIIRLTNRIDKIGRIV